MQYYCIYCHGKSFKQCQKFKLKENPLHVLLYSGSDKKISIIDGHANLLLYISTRFKNQNHGQIVQEQHPEYQRVDRQTGEPEYQRTDRQTGRPIQICREYARTDGQTSRSILTHKKIVCIYMYRKIPSTNYKYYNNVVEIYCSLRY